MFLVNQITFSLTPEMVMKVTVFGVNENVVRLSRIQVGKGRNRKENEVT